MAFVDQPESGGFDFLTQEGFLDAVQGARLGDAGAGPARVVGDHEDDARFVRGEGFGETGWIRMAGHFCVPHVL